MHYFNNFSLDDLTEVFEGVLYKEEWRDIPRYEGKYSISSFGRVKSLKWCGSNKHRILKQGTFCGGYKNVSLCKDGKSRSFNIHRLVAEAFIPNPENKRTVNHKKYDSSDNRFHQLEWFTHGEQVRDCWCAGRMEKVRKAVVANQKIAVLSTRKKVYQYAKNGLYIRSFNCLADAAKSINRTKMSISDAALCKKRTGGGYFWRYYKVKKLHIHDR